MSKKKHLKAISKVKNYTVVQANDLIRNKKDFTLWELRVFALLASHVKKDDDDFQLYKFRIRDLLDLFDVDSNNLHKELRKVPKKLHSKIISVPIVKENGKTSERNYNLVSMTEIPTGDNIDENDYIMLRFDKDLKPLMLQLGEHFTVYKFYNVLKLRSPYIFQLYEILKSQEYKGSEFVIIELEELRVMIQIPASYKFGNIKQRILTPAQKQFKEHTDIMFDFMPVKGRGGKVVKLKFKIYKNTPNRQRTGEQDAILEKIEEGSKPDMNKLSKVVKVKSDPLFDELFPQVEHLNITKKVFKKWLNTYQEQQIRMGVTTLLNALKSGKEITNAAGYLQELIRQPNLFDAVTAKKEQAAVKRKEQKERIRKKEQFEAEEKRLRGELFAKESAIVEALFIEEPDLQERMFEEMKTNRFAKYDANKSMEENYQQRFFKLAAYNAVKKKYPERFKKIQERYQPQIEQLSKQIKSL